MTALAAFCVVVLLITIPSDLFVAGARDVEVWFGFELHGRLAMLTAPIHWAIFALGAWGFWTARPWIVPCAAGYVFYVALCHLVWSEASPHGRGWPIGLLEATVLTALGMLLLRSGRSLRASQGHR